MVPIIFFDHKNSMSNSLGNILVGIHLVQLNGAKLDLLVLTGAREGGKKKERGKNLQLFHLSLCSNRDLYI